VKSGTPTGRRSDADAAPALSLGSFISLSGINYERGLIIHGRQLELNSFHHKWATPERATNSAGPTPNQPGGTLDRGVHTCTYVVLPILEF
jgi:hypothetical protein